jgi:hypothetical protein
MLLGGKFYAARLRRLQALTPDLSRLDCGLPKIGSITEVIVAAGRSKKKLKNRPKYKRERFMRDRKMKAKKKAAHKRGLNRGKKRRKAKASRKK